MISPEGNKFLNKVLSFVRFPFDRATIRLELENHIEDKVEFCIQKGLEKDDAEKQAIIEMGSAREIGMALNKEHNPWLGWLWKITNVIVVFIILVIFLLYVLPLAVSLFEKDPLSYIPKDNISYHIQLDKTIYLDDSILKFTDVIYDKDGNLHVAYKYYHRWLRGGGWSFTSMGTFEDNFGSSYLIGEEAITSGAITRGMFLAKHFNEKADKLIIKYNRFNRKYQVEVFLKEGEGN